MEKPEVDFNPEPAPSELVIRDISIGDGPEAVAGGTISELTMKLANSLMPHGIVELQQLSHSMG